MAADHGPAARGEPAIPRRQRLWLNRVAAPRVGRVKNVHQESVREAIEAIARGEIVVVTDDDDRENEGDLIIAAAHATP